MNAPRVIIAGQLVTASAIDWSNVDPGGCESATIGIEVGHAPSPGDEVLIFEGLECVFEGEVDEPGQRHVGKVASANIAAVGAGVAAKRTYFSMIFIDRDMSRWGAMSVQRDINLGNAGFPTDDGGGWSVNPDKETGRPSLTLAFTNVVTTAARKPIIEAWYDAGPNCLIDTFDCSWRTYDKASGGLNLLAGSWNPVIKLATDDIVSVSNSSAILLLSGDLSLTSGSGNRRYALVELFYNAVVATGAGDWRLMIDNMRVMGDHGLLVQVVTGDLDGIFSHDIARWGLEQLDGAFDTDIETSTLVIPHSAYHEDAAVEQLWADLGVLTGGWHWGVWPRDLLGDRPKFSFRSPAPVANAVVQYNDLEQPDLTERASAMFNRAIILYTDSFGTPQRTTVDIPHPRLQPDIVSETLITLGVASETSATAIGTSMLLSQQLSNRMSGSVTLPEFIAGSAGELVKSSTLRSGIDRIQILGLPVSDGLVDDRHVRGDTFHIKRVSNSYANFTIRTVVEVDTGADLIETLNARLAVNAVAVGGGG